LALSSSVHGELLAGPFHRTFFIGCRNDPKALGLLVAHDVDTPKARHLSWSLHGYAPE
jgi:hypothetical protein